MGLDIYTRCTFSMVGSALWTWIYLVVMGDVFDL